MISKTNSIYVKTLPNQQAKNHNVYYIDTHTHLHTYETHCTIFGFYSILEVTANFFLFFNCSKFKIQEALMTSLPQRRIVWARHLTKNFNPHALSFFFFECQSFIPIFFDKTSWFQLPPWLDFALPFLLIFP